tara:strand:+ start:1371 stop:1784 length:414 start_codon:yes stop_codon:yes gene_type:complete
MASFGIYVKTAIFNQNETLSFMKNLDTFSKRFISVSLSVMGLILCASLFMYASTPANASITSGVVPEFAKKDFPASAGGSIMMDYTSVHVPSQDKTYYEALVWNTETGQSKLYFYSFDSKTFKAYEDNVQLPKRPLD